MDLFSEELRGNGPMYRQIYLYIADAIMSGRLRAGERLPSKRALATQLGVSVITVQGAYDMLCDEGYISARPRSGFFVQKIDTPRVGLSVGEKPAHTADDAFLYDFRMNAVDRENFPYKIWGKLLRESVLDGADLLCRGDARGDIHLRRSIAYYLEQMRGVRCSPRQIFIGAGIEYLQMLLCRMFEDRLFAVEDPCYPKLRRVLENDGRRFVCIPLQEDGLSLDMLKTSGADIVCVTPSHQFPTGVQMSAAKRGSLLNWAYADKKRYIIEDDFGGEFDLDGMPARCLQGLDRNGRVIYMGSFSRILAPSVRIAYMALPFELLNVTQARFSAYSSTVSAFEQRALSQFIDQGHMERHIRRTKNILRSRRQVLAEIVAAVPKDRRPAFDPAAVSSHAVLALKRRSSDFVLQAAQRGVRVYDMADFYGSPSARENRVLLGISDISEEKMREAGSVLQELF